MTQPARTQDTLDGDHLYVHALQWFLFFSHLQDPFADNSELQQRTARMLSLNTWDVAVALTNYDWSVFDSVHEVRPGRTVRLSERLSREQSFNPKLVAVLTRSKNSSTSPSAATGAAATRWRWSCCCSGATWCSCG